MRRAWSAIASHGGDAVRKNATAMPSSKARSSRVSTGRSPAVGAYFGQEVRGIVERLLAEQLSDGGWNCEAANGGRRSSFNTTICVVLATF